MSYYTVYIGGARNDRETTDEDIFNVNKVLSLDTSGGCYTKLYNDSGYIAQLEHVLDALVSISYIQGDDNLKTVIDMVKAAGITAYSVMSHGNDKECLVELSYIDYAV